jgi:hypothetical protein
MQTMLLVGQQTKLRRPKHALQCVNDQEIYARGLETLVHD